MLDLLPDLCDRFGQDVRWLPLTMHDYGAERFFMVK